ncbi:TPA: hypothetical protein DEO28_02060 [Candidatus Dependentiae bacterium]|nr:MAG: Nucleotidyltransferase substrate binding protein, HI0074 family [candidate division TM6 bacterium GW2011_GWE2_31_21]KKP53014.1 MAG: Nucleotidyltransferase substrate binding protein, HI0074 family [candidate division TM6 bacterium GW2011_GWF2_33_332]HBS47749.1 hypothetical protein [Candidatus Dependentiae bacterium]HBZ73275.1 hypothetical protein [Candidatus Dependentiae bacterium]
MEALNGKYETCIQALKTLKEGIDSIDILKQQTFTGISNEDLKKIFRDSIIQRFEYSFDCVWKYLKLFLENQKIILEIKSPKYIFRQLMAIGIINEEECLTGMQMVDDRNLTTHLYNEKKTNEIAINILQYHKLMKTIMEKSKPELCLGSN